MAYNTPPTKSTGDTWSAAEHNLYIRNNMEAQAPAVFSHKGDLFVGTDIQEGTVLMVGSNGQVLVADSTQPNGMAWKTLVSVPTTGAANGKLLGHNGTNPEWQSVPVLPDTAGWNVGDVLGISGAGTIDWKRPFPTGTSGKPMLSNGSYGATVGEWPNRLYIPDNTGNRLASYSTTYTATGNHSISWTAFNPSLVNMSITDLVAISVRADTSAGDFATSTCDTKIEILNPYTSEIIACVYNGQSVCAVVPVKSSGFTLNVAFYNTPITFKVEVFGYWQTNE